jgi:mannitol/fructose-specific phosphotransferase system IIA component (Ntr-type)
MMIVDYTKAEYIKYLESNNKYNAIEELAEVFNGSNICEDTGILISALREREEIMSTGIGLGIAIPHAKLDCINEMAFAIGISKEGIEFDSLDGNPVHLIILVAAGESQHKDYLRLLSNIMKILKNKKVKDKIVNASTPEELLDIIKREAEKLA